jgi:plastocyanin
MKRKFTSILKLTGQVALIFAFINLFAGCMGMKHAMKTDMTDHGAGIVLMKHDRFSPGSMTVPVNSTVTWTNKDWWKHTISSDNGIFDSGKIKSGKSFTHKFATAGTYSYHCKIHDRMIGKVIVK